MRKSNPAAFGSLKRHLVLGGWIKSAGLVLLSELQRIDFLTHLPILGGLLKVVRGLVFGHITEALLSQKSWLASETHVKQSGTNESVVYVDVLIIGSGPGGAVAARHRLLATHPSVHKIGAQDAARRPRRPVPYRVLR